MAVRRGGAVAPTIVDRAGRMIRRLARPASVEGLLGTLELAAMRALWADAPASVTAVLERINADRPRTEGLAYTTVMTVLSRLHDMGMVTREKVGRGYDYAPAFDAGGLVAHLSRQEVDDLVNRYGEVVLAQFAAALADARSRSGSPRE